MAVVDRSVRKKRVFLKEDCSHWNRPPQAVLPRRFVPISSETLKQDLDQLIKDQLQQVADFIAFLKFRNNRDRTVLDPARLALLATEFAEEDLALAEVGMSDYATMLIQEDQR